MSKTNPSSAKKPVKKEKSNFYKYYTAKERLQIEGELPNYVNWTTVYKYIDDNTDEEGAPAVSTLIKAMKKLPKEEENKTIKKSIKSTKKCTKKIKKEIESDNKSCEPLFSSVGQAWANDYANVNIDSSSDEFESDSDEIELTKKQTEEAEKQYKAMKPKKDTWFDIEEEQQEYETKNPIKNRLDWKLFNPELCTNISILNALLNVKDYDIRTCTTPSRKLQISIYLFDNTTTLYRKIPVELLRNLLSRDMLEIILVKKNELSLQLAVLKNKKKAEALSERIEYLDKVRNKVESIIFMNQVTNAFCVHQRIYVEDLYEKFDSNTNVVNFRNYILDNKTGKFRRRTPNDYYTKTLDFNYNSSYDVKAYEHIGDIYFRVCNNDIDLVEFYRRWFGYCMTGITSEQVALWIIGQLSSNGKSSLIEAFVQMFSIYVKEFDSETFNKNYNKKYKQFAESKLVRAAFLEELDKDKIDETAYKKVMSGSTIGGNEILFGTSEDIDIFFKVMFLSNKYPNISSDKAVNRRTACIEHKNTFENMKDDEIEEKAIQCIYPIDKRVNNKKTGYFSEDKYKLALFHYLLPGMKESYVCGLEGSGIEKHKKTWLNISDDSDYMQIFLEARIDYTGKDEDKIHKSVFLKEYHEYYPGYDKVSWLTLLCKLKSKKEYKIVYKDQVRSLDINGCSMKGSIIGVKLNPKTKTKAQKNLDNLDNSNEVVDI